MARGSKIPQNILNKKDAPSPVVEDKAVQAPETPSETVEVQEDAKSIVTMEDAKNDFLRKMEAKKKKLRVEDTHTRSTFLFRNDLQERLDKLAKKSKVRGFKTEFINDAIEKMLNEYE